LKKGKVEEKRGVLSNRLNSSIPQSPRSYEWEAELKA